MFKNNIKWSEIIPIIIVLYFPIKHYQDLNNIPFFRTIFSLVYILLILIILIISSKNRNQILTILPNLKMFYLYIILQNIILIWASFYSPNFIYATTRAGFSIVSLALIFTVFYFAQYFYTKNRMWQKYFEIVTLIFLISIILGQILISEWSWGEGLRFSGGINPNRMAFLILLFLFQTHLNALILGKWTKIQKIVWSLSLVVLIWTFSRTVILTVLITYTVYLLLLLITEGKSLPSFFNKIKFKKIHMIIWSSIMLIFILLVGVILIRLNNNNVYEMVLDRFSNSDNLKKRFGAWKMLLSSFNETYLTGKYGWWGTRDVLDSVKGVADSSHNFFVRTLAETGIIGLISILALPLGIISLLVAKREKIREFFKSPIETFLVVVLISIFFVAQFFEDRYLVMQFSTYSDVIIWFMSFSLLIYHFGVGKIKDDGKAIDSE